MGDTRRSARTRLFVETRAPFAVSIFQRANHHAFTGPVSRRLRDQWSQLTWRRISVRGIVAAASIASAPFAFLAGDYNGTKRSEHLAFVDLDILNNQMRQKIPAATDDDLIKAMELLSAKRKSVHWWLLSHSMHTTQMATERIHRVTKARAGQEHGSAVANERHA